MHTRDKAHRRARSRKLPLILWLLILLLMPISVRYSIAAQDIPQSEIIPDNDITFAVESELILSEEVPAHMINVETDEGIVRLSGTVDNFLARERATEIAATIKGVRAIVNDIAILPSERTDEQIQADVREALAADPATEEYEISVRVDDGTVELTGAVESNEERELAEDVAGSVKGVLGVQNYLNIEYGAERTDDEIYADVVRRLDRDVWVTSDDITVTVDNAAVTLSGTVGSLVEKRQVISDAWVSGTQSVDADDLSVEWWDRDSMQRESVTASRSDDDIRSAVLDALRYDPRVSASAVTVEVNDGKVRLTGTVDNLVAKVAASRDARNTRGVWKVNNHIRVRPESVPDDEELAARIESALSRDPYVELLEIDVYVRNGLVTLTGTVNSSFEKRHAGEVVRKVNGVADVANELVFNYTWVRKSDWEIREDVQDQLYWSQKVNEEDITVTVDGGIVQLTGEVNTHGEWLAAERNAFQAGAKDVDNDLRISRDVPFPDYVGP